jgi:predicted signal transduction protein with EAL and GGDEF domain
LRQLGCTGLQGYLFGKPAPVEQLRWGSLMGAHNSVAEQAEPAAPPRTAHLALISPPAGA